MHTKLFYFIYLKTPISELLKCSVPLCWPPLHKKACLLIKLVISDCDLLDLVKILQTYTRAWEDFCLLQMKVRVLMTWRQVSPSQMSQFNENLKLRTSLLIVCPNLDMQIAMFIHICPQSHQHSSSQFCSFVLFRWGGWRRPML